jgi:hypothetical protein
MYSNSNRLCPILATNPGVAGCRPAASAMDEIASPMVVVIPKFQPTATPRLNSWFPIPQKRLKHAEMPPIYGISVCYHTGANGHRTRKVFEALLTDPESFNSLSSGLRGAI